MSKFLAIDTSSKYLSVLAVNEEKVVPVFDGACALNHSVKLMSAVQTAMDEAQLTPGECDFFSAVIGPGSFTGIRIGISTAKGFSVATGKPLVGVTSFDLIAYNTKCQNFVAVIDAAHGHFYACEYKNGVAGEPCYISQEELEGSPLPLFGFESLSLKNYEQVDVKEGFYPAVMANVKNASFDLGALYIRKSQAEEGRK